MVRGVESMLQAVHSTAVPLERFLVPSGLERLGPSVTGPFKTIQDSPGLFRTVRTFLVILRIGPFKERLVLLFVGFLNPSRIVRPSEWSKIEHIFMKYIP